MSYYKIFLKSLEQFENSFNVISENIKKSFDSIDFNKIRQRMNELPEEIKLAQDKLLSRGWYVSGVFGINDLREILSMDNNEIDNFMISYGKYFENSLVDSIKIAYPHREKIVEDAIKAHKLKMYNISIPAMLTQCDGISKELLGVDFFGKKNRVPKTKDVRLIIKSNIDDRISDLFFLRPLDIVTSLSMDTNDRNKKIQNDNSFSLTLNRHGVLHGADISYGTESNSYRCIILLEYLLNLKEKYFKE